MKTRETKKQKRSPVILSEATDGVNKVRLMGLAAEGEEEACPWEEIDDYSGRFVVAGHRYDDDENIQNENYHPWLAYSTDGGKTWTKSETTADENQTHRWLRALAYGGGRFVVAGYRYDGEMRNWYHPWLAYSTDGGKTWTESETTAEEDQPHGQLHALAYGGGRFVVAGYRFESLLTDTDNYHPWLAYSTDGGKTWTKSETTAKEDQPHGQLFALAYGGGRFVVAGYRYENAIYEPNITEDTSNNSHPWLAYSTDGGKTWTRSETTAKEDQPHGRLHALAYGGGRFVVAGYRFEPDTTGGDTTDNYHPWLAYSIDGGKTWTRSETTAKEDQPHGQLHALTYGGGRFVVAGYRYESLLTDTDNYHPWLAYSTDGGKTWTRSETTADENQTHGQLYALAYGGGRFVVAGYRFETDDTDNYHPWLAYSSDGGETWTKSETTASEGQTHGQLYALIYAPDSYCWKFGKEEETEETSE